MHNLQESRYARWKPQPPPTLPFYGECEYDHMVDELASRGFTLGSLLEFLCVLLDTALMPSFNPRTSTTNEVAYEAILHVSEGGPFARILTCGERCYPECLITHTWSNIFCHTIAAVVGDAMGSAYFFHLLPRLRTLKRVRTLMNQLDRDNLLHKTYWFCAFSIDQHVVACNTARLCSQGHLLRLAIVDPLLAPCTGCDGEEGRSSTRFKCDPCNVRLCLSCKGKAVQACNCHKPKLLAGDARCEVDKFDDMMAWLRKVLKEKFRQVVALDEGGAALKRTWVVAEIAQAQRDELKQNIQVLFPLSISRRSLADQILKIDVRYSQASHPEDSAMILAKIKDKDAYNENVRRKLLMNTKHGWAWLFALVAVVMGALACTMVLLREVFVSLEKSCPDQSCVLYSLLPIFANTFTLLLVASHFRYHAISRSVRDARGYRVEVLSVLQLAGGGFNILKKIQTWYARQYTRWDVADDDAEDSGSSRCLSALDAFMVGALRFTMVLLNPSTWAIDEQSSRQKDFLWHASLIAGVLETVFLLYYDPAVRCRAWRGLAVLVLVICSLAGIAIEQLDRSATLLEAGLFCVFVASVLVLLFGALFGGHCDCCCSSHQPKPQKETVGRPITAFPVKTPENATPYMDLVVPVPLGRFSL